MPLGEEDYLSWYNAEISRYRDIEWAVSGYAGAFSLAVIYLATDPDRNTYILRHPWWTSIILSAFAIFLIWSEAHIHWRLNDFRAKRDALLGGNGGHKNRSGCLIARKKDGSYDLKDLTYFLAFESFILGMTVLAIVFVWASKK